MIFCETDLTQLPLGKKLWGADQVYGSSITYSLRVSQPKLWIKDGGKSETLYVRVN